MNTPPPYPEAFALSASLCFSVRISSKRFVTLRMIIVRPVSWPDQSRGGTIVNSMETARPFFAPKGTARRSP